MYEELIATLATHFADLRTGERDAGIDAALRTIHCALAADACCIHLHSESGGGLALDARWCVDVRPHDGVWSELLRSTLKGVGERLAKSETVCVSNGAAAATAAASVHLPLVTHGSLVGVLSIEWHGDRAVRAVAESGPMRKALRVVGDIVTGAVEQLRADDSLRSTEERLRDSQRLEALGHLSGGVAHDFNNFLTAIIGNCELLLDEIVEDEVQQDEVDEIRRAAERASTLVDRILSFGRRTRSRPRVLDVNWVVADMEKLIRRVVGEGIAVVVDLKERCGVIRADPGQIEQVLLNLAVNARDAMPDGGTLVIRVGDLEVSDSPVAPLPGSTPPGHYVELSVRDDGCGMNEQTRERLFDPFFTTKTRARGTGLGLSTVAGIVRELHGVIAVASEPEAGSTFSVLIPRAEGIADHRAARDERPTATGGSETVLVVEEERAVRQLLRRVLEHDGYSVLEATDDRGALAVSVRHHGAIDLVVTDLALPHLRGRALAEELQRHRPELRVLFTSCYPESAIREEGVLEESAVLVEKPFAPGALAWGVRRSLDAARAVDHRGVISSPAIGPRISDARPPQQSRRGVRDPADGKPLGV